MAPGERYEELCDELLASPGVSIGRALSNEGLMVGGKLFAFQRRDNFVVKLPVDRVAEVVGSGDGVVAVMGTRVMKQWVELPPSADWSSYANESCAFVRALTAGGAS